MGVAGRAGRRGKTRVQLNQSGTYRKDKHGELRNPRPTSGMPEVPCELDALEQGAWDRLVWAFQDMEILHQVSHFSMVHYCQLFAENLRVRDQQRVAQASVAILEANIRDVAKDDLVRLFGEIVTLHKLIAQCTNQLRAGHLAILRYLVEFGLTPASLGRIKLPSTGEEVDEFTAYQAGRQAS